MSGIVSVDHEYRGREYRIAEPFRSLGASIRPVDIAVHCGNCSRLMTHGARHYRSGNGITIRCVRCAIRDGLLILLDLEARYTAFQANRA